MYSGTPRKCWIAKQTRGAVTPVRREVRVQAQNHDLGSPRDLARECDVNLPRKSVVGETDPRVEKKPVWRNSRPGDRSSGKVLSTRSQTLGLPGGTLCQDPATTIEPSASRATALDSSS